MKRKRSSRRKNTNLLKLAEAGVIASIMTQNMAGTTLRNFVTNENPSDGVTFMELVRGSPAVMGAKGGLGIGRPAMSTGANWDTLWQNTKSNAVPLLVGVIGTPIIFRAGKKFARPVLTPIRGLLKGSGVTV
ncbi:unnamed protein product [marine sediment metagenome]|uniref:Uncharacterized protein n=1 Tax=marine sediment metagenome TaxID=412755 RepID=X1SUK8_9ZZZZ